MENAADRANLLSKQITACALTALHTFGTGFLEKVYEKALVDLLVENVVLVELKVARGIDHIHQAQCLNYLKATGLPLCLLLNFGSPRLDIKRLILSQ